MTASRTLCATLLALALGTGSADAAPGGFGFETNFMKIGDGPGGTYGSGYHNLAVDGQNVFAAFTGFNSAYGHGEVTVGVSRDSGFKWESSVVVAHAPLLDHNGAAIAISPARGLLHVVWGDRETNAIYHSVASGTGQLYFSAPIVVSGSLPATTWARSVAADANGGVHVAFVAGSGIYYTRSDDDGSTFAEPTLVVANAYQPEIVADAAGNVVLSWGDQNGVFVVRRPAGGSWSAPVRVNASQTPAAYYPSLVLRDFQNLYVAWQTPAGVYVARTSNGGATWSEALAMQGSYLDVSLAADASGGLTVMSGASNYGSLWYAKSADGARWTAPRQVLADVRVYFPNLAVDAAGRVLVMYESSDATRFTREP